MEPLVLHDANTRSSNGGGKQQLYCIYSYIVLACHSDHSLCTIFPPHSHPSTESAHLNDKYTNRASKY